MKNKYRAQPVEIDGIRFASKAEGRRYQQLRLLEKSGEITDLECHPAFKFAVNGVPVKIRSAGFPNGRQAGYRGDFRYWDRRSNSTVVEDVKGGNATRTEAYALRKALVEALFPGVKIVEVKA